MRRSRFAQARFGPARFGPSAQLLLVILALFALAFQVPAQAGAQEGTGASEDPPIQDNSFLIEEAYNQEPGVVQHISTFRRDRESGEWDFSFTQEWPVVSQKHQLSFTLPVSGGADEGGSGTGDLALNYRYQWVGDGAAPVAFSPRFTLLLPTGSVDDGRGSGALGYQVNLPLSTVLAPGWVAHSNAGATFTLSAENAAGSKADTWSVSLGQSLIWQRSARLNFLLEAVWERGESVVSRGRTEEEKSFFLSPGVRWAYNFPSGLQIVPGIAVPIGVGPSSGEKSLFLYVSFEHAFKETR